jgi:hypothetical protein
MSGVVPSCSGNGVLVDGLCVCDPAWTSLGDFNPVPGLDCGINRQSIFAIAIVSLILGGIVMVTFTYFVYQRIVASRAKTKMDLKMRFALTYLLQTITCNIYDIAVIYNPETSIIGVSVLSTVMCATAWFTAYGGCVVFFECILQLLQGMSSILSHTSRAAISGSIDKFQSITKYLYAICVISAFACLTSLMVPPEKCYLTAKVLFSCWNVFHLGFCISWNAPVTVICREIKIFTTDLRSKQSAGTSDMESQDSVVDPKVFEDVRFNIMLAQVCINGLFIVTLVVYLLWTVWDFLTRKTIYVTLYCTIGVHVISVPMLMALSYKVKGEKVAPAPQQGGDGSGPRNGEINMAKKTSDELIPDHHPFPTGNAAASDGSCPDLLSSSLEMLRLPESTTS